MKRSAHPEGRRHREAVSESNVIEEEQLVDSGTGLQPVRTARYTWGTDVSGTLQGAGGVGGLLRADEVVGTAAATTHYYWYDGNGNATGLMRANGTIDATYRYTAFGGKASETYTVGTFGERNRYRFSTKYLDNEVETVEGTYYYGYRHYAVAMGRWTARDPIGEAGGMNEMVFVLNDSTSGWDYLGLKNPYREKPDGAGIGGGGGGGGIGGLPGMPNNVGFPRLSPPPSPRPAVPHTSPRIPSPRPVPIPPPTTWPADEWADAGVDEVERERRRRKVRECRDLHGQYKKAQKGSRDYHKLDCCEAICNALSAAQDEVSGRSKYMDRDCDEVPWGGLSNHDQELLNAKSKLSNLHAKVQKHECSCN